MPQNITEYESVHNLTITSESGSEVYDFMNKNKEIASKFVENNSTPRKTKDESENLSFDFSDENNKGPPPPRRFDGKFLKRTHKNETVNRYLK